MTLEALTAMNAVQIVQSDTTVYDPPLKAVVVSAVGSLVIENGIGQEITFVVPAAVANETVTAVPFILWGRVRKVKAATTLADANLLGLR